MSIIDEDPPLLLQTSFNQDCTCFSVVKNGSYEVYVCDPFIRKHVAEVKNIGRVTMLFNSALVVLVGSGRRGFSARKLKLLNSVTSSIICERSFVDNILNVQLNNKRMIVVLETKIHIFNISDMEMLHTVDTGPNKEGIACLCPGDASIMAYAHNSTIYVYDTFDLRPIGIIKKAHNSKVTVLKFNFEGNLLATASESGMIAHVFSLPSMKSMASFRRGSYPATIFDLSFNLTSTLLALVSSSGTLHVFRVEHTATALSSYLPEIVSHAIEPVRSVVKAKLPSELQTICGFSPTSQRLLAATVDGHFYQYDMDVNGGECNLSARDTFLEDRMGERRAPCTSVAVPLPTTSFEVD